MVDWPFVALLLAFLTLAAGLVRICELNEQRSPIVTWLDQVSGLAVLVILVYLVIVLFRPEFVP
jgi:uncharacterized membrane protein